MILTRNEILKELNLNKITISPFHIKQLNPNSYNYRLSDHIAVPEFDPISQTETYHTIQIPKEGFILRPGCTYLSHTFETLGSSEYAMSLIGRSSLGRLGLFLQVSANLGHTTSCHKWTLEIVACKTIIVYPEMIIGQISFWKNVGEYHESAIRYNKYNFLTPSLD
ncbi:MAG: deoxycytidine deaminase [Parachlamydia sp.]|nr:MAG: deoxycytidine deaminase [Parachlamydia sp.]